MFKDFWSDQIFFLEVQLFTIILLYFCSFFRIISLQKPYILRLIIFPFSPKYGTLSEKIGFHTTFQGITIILRKPKWYTIQFYTIFFEQNAENFKKILRPF